MDNDEACPVGYPPAEPTDPTVWEVWAFYWKVQNLGWDMVRDLGSLDLSEREAEELMVVFQEIHGAVERRRYAEANKK